jgi:hypothetical protein
MKKYAKVSFLLIAFACLTFSSCKEEVDIITENSAKMVGNWKATTYSQSNCTDPTENIDLVFGADGACLDDPTTGATACIILDFVFSNGGGLTATFDTEITFAGLPVSQTIEVINGTWTVLSETRMQVCLDNDNDSSSAMECSTGTYTISDTTMTYSGNNSDNGCDVSMTATKQ